LREKIEAHGWELEAVRTTILIGKKVMSEKLLSHHIEDIRRSGLTHETIDALGFHSGIAAEIEAIPGSRTEHRLHSAASYCCDKQSWLSDRPNLMIFYS
jgi:hypothetical protein